MTGPAPTAGGQLTGHRADATPRPRPHRGRSRARRSARRRQRAPRGPPTGGRPEGWSADRATGVAGGVTCDAAAPNLRRPGSPRARRARWLQIRHRVGRRTRHARSAAAGMRDGHGVRRHENRPRGAGGSRGTATARPPPGLGRIKPTARCGPYGGARRGWRDRRGYASAAGSRGSWRDGGCSAGRCACSRRGSLSGGRAACSPRQAPGGARGPPCGRQSRRSARTDISTVRMASGWVKRGHRDTPRRDRKGGRSFSPVLAPGGCCC